MEKRYYPACNSGSGFKSFFDEIFKDLNRLYILKGGPGTGKSKLMRDIANEAKNKDYDVEYYHCSSDPDSLDGIIIRDIGVGMLDGTAPHARDPKTPGAYDEIINLGDFWSVDKLKPQQYEIERLNSEKSSLYAQAYHNLGIISLIDKEINGMICNSVDMSKLEKAASYIVKGFKTGSGYAVHPRILNSIGMNGIANFNTFYELAQTHYVIHDRYCIASIMFQEILKLSPSKQQPVCVSCTPFNTESANALYYPELSISFTDSGNNARLSTDKFIDTRRFIKTDIINKYKQKINFARKCRNTVLDDTLDIFSHIRETHFELEKIYTSAMVFKRKEEYTKKLLIKIFK